MSQENVELVRGLLALWNTHDRGAQHLTEYLRPEIELDSPLASVAGEPYRGYSGIEQWIRDIDEQFAEWSIVADDVRDCGDRVVAIATTNARARASEIAMQFPAACVCDFGPDARVTHMRIYWDVQEALKAVGLEE